MTVADLSIVDPKSGDLDHVETRFVAFAPPDDASLTHARRAAEATGADGLQLPLLVLGGPDERTHLAAYAAWLTPSRFDALADYLDQLTLQRVAASIHGFDVTDGGTVLQIVGTMRRRGTDQSGDGRLVRVVLVGTSGDERLTVEAVPEQRFEDGATRWTGFRASLPIDELPTGSTMVSVELDGRRVVRRTAKAAVGLLAASRPVTTRGRRLQLVQARGSDQVELLCRPAHSPAARLGWHLAMLRRDLGQLVRRRPFAWIRFIRALTWVIGLGRPIWLIGERPDTARDNGSHLFCHLRTERPEIRAYYVLDRDSARYAELSRLGRVVAHSSWRHRLLMLHATVMANAYSIKHMTPRQWDPGVYQRQGAWRVGAHRVYLKHGINVNTKALRRRVGGYELYLTALSAESKACRETSGYDRQIVETGMPRYDALAPTASSRTILFMPTWRLYLAAKLFSDQDTGAVAFAGSTYERFVTGVLTSDRLRDMLERYDHRLQLMPHYNLGQHLADVPLTTDRITILDGASDDIQDVMRNCDLFVTDHSSVHFDLAYLGTPVIYAHFDNDEYAAGHAEPSWFDHERDGFGPVTIDVESTLDAIQHYLETDNRREDIYSQRAENAFTFHDAHNSRRTVEAIEELVRTRGIG
ncbi:CDP-glycerol glycerophosphotransferase family protein [Aeromicrobium sp. P5_D10]